MRVVLLLLIASPLFAQMDAREQEYYDWCRQQGGTPEGSGWDLHCTPPAGGGGQADGAAIPAPTNVRDAVMFGLMKGLSNAVIKGIQDSAAQRRAAAAAPAPLPNYGQWRQQQSAQGDSGEQYRREQEERQRADEDAKRRELQNELVVPGQSAPSSAPELVIPEAPKPAAPVSDGGARVRGATPRDLSEAPDVDCRGAKRRSLECVDSDAIDVPEPPYLAKDDEARARANERTLLRELDERRDDADIARMDRESADYLKKRAQDEYEDKGKSYLLSGEAGAKVSDVLDKVKDAGSITKEYASKTLDAFRGETTSAACILGSAAPNSCWDAYHAQAARADGDAGTLDRETAAFVAKSYGGETLMSKARHEILGGDGAELFFEGFK